MKNTEKKNTTKICPNCKNVRLSKFYSNNKKYCTDCNTWIDWFLDEGQKSIFSNLEDKHFDYKNVKLEQN